MIDDLLSDEAYKLNSIYNIAEANDKIHTFI